MEPSHGVGAASCSSLMSLTTRASIPVAGVRSIIAFSFRTSPPYNVPAAPDSSLAYSWP